MFKLTALLFAAITVSFPALSHAQVSVEKVEAIQAQEHVEKVYNKALAANEVTAKEVLSAPDLIQPLVVAVAAIPKVGPIIVSAFKWVITIGGIFTALSIAVSGILLTLSGLLKVPQMIAVWSNAPQMADKFEKWSIAVKKFNDVIQPYLKYISQFNVKKSK
jgi:hypothetical protein